MTLNFTIDIRVDLTVMTIIIQLIENSIIKRLIFIVYKKDKRQKKNKEPK